MSNENIAPKNQYFDPATVVVNPAIAARKGPPVKQKVDWFANNFLERRESGMPHQESPGLVRVLDDGTVEVITGGHRLAACQKLNANLPEGEEPFMFLAIATPATNEQALLRAIDENEFRVASSPFDKGEAAKKLIDLGYTQDQIAKKFGKAVSTVSELLRCADLPKKVQAMYDKGEVTEETLYIWARYNKDRKLQEELIQLAVQERDARKAIEARAEARANGTPEPAESAAVSGEESEATEQSNTSKAPVSDAVKNKKKKKSSNAVTAADAKSAVKKKGAQKKKTEVKKGRSKTDLLKFVEAICGESVTDCPEPWREFGERLEAFLDEDISEAAFKNTWVKCMREKYAASKGAA